MLLFWGGMVSEIGEMKKNYLVYIYCVDMMGQINGFIRKCVIINYHF